MAGLSPTDFRTTDKVSNSAWKGFTRDDSSVPNDKPTGKSNKSGTAKGFDFDSLSDEEKKCFNLAINDWQQAAANPGKWAQTQSVVFKANAGMLKKAASKLRQDLDADGQAALEYPWWSAARDWDPNEIGQMGQTIANGIKPSQAVISGIQQRF